MNENACNMTGVPGPSFGGNVHQPLAALLARAEQTPLDNPERIVSALEKPLFLLRRTDLSPARRFQALERLVRPLSALDCSVQALVGTSPLSAAGRRLIFATDSLLTEYLAGYQQCLKVERTAGLFTRWRYRNIWTVCAHRAITLMGLLAETGRMVDRPAAPGFWLEMQRIYQRAAEAGWMYAEVPGFRAPGNFTTLEWEYRRILLLSQIPPQMLDIRSGRELAVLLSRCVDGLQPVAPRNGRAPVGFVGFGMQQGLNIPPKPLSAESASRGSRDTPNWELLYNAERLMAELAILINRAEASEHRQITLPEGSIRLGTLMLLWRSWFVEESQEPSPSPDVAKPAAVGSHRDAAQEISTTNAEPPQHPAAGDERRFGDGMPATSQWEERMKRLERMLDEERCSLPPVLFGGAGSAAGAQAVVAR